MEKFNVIILLFLTGIFLLGALEAMRAKTSFSCKVEPEPEPVPGTTNTFSCKFLSNKLSSPLETEDLTCDGNVFWAELKLWNQGRIEIICPWTSKTIFFEGAGVLFVFIFAVAALASNREKQGVSHKVTFFIGLTGLLCLLYACATMVMSLSGEVKTCIGADEKGVYCNSSSNGYYKTPALTFFSSVIFAVCVFAYGRKPKQIDDEETEYWIPKVEK